MSSSNLTSMLPGATRGFHYVLTALLIELARPFDHARGIELPQQLQRDLSRQRLLPYRLSLQAEF